MIYLDNAATTPVDKQVFEVMQPYFSDIFGNASSLHSYGQESAKAVAESRDKIAIFLNCSAEEIIFTSGATEADNLAIMGLVPWTSKIHIITSTIEHPAVLEVCRHLEKTNHAEVSYIKPDSDGIIKVEDVKKAIKDNTRLVSIMYANNEIGTIQPIQEIGQMIKEVNAERQRSARNASHSEAGGDPSSQAPQDDIGKKIFFHTDAVQAVNYCEMDVDKLGVDLVSISGHKIYGPKGIGALYVSKGTPLKPILFGGHHEHGLRPGTINTPLIVGLGKAIELIKTRDNKKIQELRDYLEQKIQEKIPHVKLNGDLNLRTPNNLNISFSGVEGEALLLDLDMNGIAISTGSACSSSSLDPSHVLMAIGLSHEDSHGSLRLSLGKDNTQQEMDIVVEKLSAAVGKFRKIAPKL